MTNQSQQLIIRLIQALALCSFAFPSLANEAALYDLAPPNSAFLRIINLQKNNPTDPITLRIENKRLSTKAYCSASDFIYLAAGERSQDVNGLPWKGILQPDQAYSLLVADESVTLLKDYRAVDSRRGMLVVYNFSDRPRLSLKTAKSALPVLTNIPQVASAARGINPLKSAFSVVDSTDIEGLSLAVTEAMIFQPGVLSSLFVCSDQSGMFTRWADRVGGH
jgi:hypothetical protein